MYEIQKKPNNTSKYIYILVGCLIGLGCEFGFLLPWLFSAKSTGYVLVGAAVVVFTLLLMIHYIIKFFTEDKK